MGQALCQALGFDESCYSAGPHVHMAAAMLKSETFSYHLMNTCHFESLVPHPKTQ